MRSQKTLGFLVFVVLLGIGVGPFPAAAGYINFDNIAPPGPSPLVLPGATFTLGPSSAAGIVSGGIVADSLASTSPNIYQAQVLANEIDTYPLIIITLDKPVSLVSFLMSCNYNINLGSWFHVVALDNNGNTLDSYVLTNPAILQMNRQLLSAEGVKSVVISAQSVSPAVQTLSVAIDNFCFYSLRPTGAVIPMF